MATGHCQLGAKTFFGRGLISLVWARLCSWGGGHFNKMSGSFHSVPGGVSREEEETSRCGVRGDREKESQEGMGPAVQEGQ